MVGQVLAHCPLRTASEIHNNMPNAIATLISGLYIVKASYIWVNQTAGCWLVVWPFTYNRFLNTSPGWYGSLDCLLVKEIWSVKNHLLLWMDKFHKSPGPNSGLSALNHSHVSRLLYSTVPCGKKKQSLTSICPYEISSFPCISKSGYPNSRFVVFELCSCRLSWSCP